MSQPLTPKRYSAEEVRAILGRAMKTDASGGVVSSSELRETAAELGVSQEALDVAMAEHDVHTALEGARVEYVGVRRQALVRQFASWLGVNVGLTVLDFLPDNHLDWAMFPAAIWGISVLYSAARTMFMTTQDIDEGAQKLLEQKERRTQKLLRARR
jgi:hypothetical protein